jgi:hypothetical protein
LTHYRVRIFYRQADEKSENPFRLAIKAANDYPSYFAPILLRLQQIHEDEMCAIVDRIPQEWMKSRAKDFFCRLPATTLQKLKRVQL